MSEGLLPTTGPKKLKQSFAGKCVVKLVNGLARHKLRTKKVEGDKWIKEFQNLEKKHPQCLIETVLAWYISNIGQEFVPEAYSARSFNLKFLQIKKQMDKQERDKPVSESELSKEELLLLKEVRHLGWTNGIDRDLAKIVQVSSQRYSKFRDDLKAFIVNAPNLVKERKKQDHAQAMRIERCARIANHLIESNKLSHQSTFLVNWLREICTIVSKGYGMSFERMCFALDNPMFVKKVAGMIYDYTHDGWDWERLLSAVYGEKDDEGRGLQNV